METLRQIETNGGEGGLPYVSQGEVRDNILQSVSVEALEKDICRPDLNSKLRFGAFVCVHLANGEVGDLQTHKLHRASLAGQGVCLSLCAACSGIIRVLWQGDLGDDQAAVLGDHFEAGRALADREWLAHCDLLAYDALGVFYEHAFVDSPDGHLQAFSRVVVATLERSPPPAG